MPEPCLNGEAAERVLVWLETRPYTDGLQADLRALLVEHAALSAKVEAVQALYDKADRYGVAVARTDLRAALGSS